MVYIILCYTYSIHIKLKINSRKKNNQIPDFLGIYNMIYDRILISELKIENVANLTESLILITLNY